MNSIALGIFASRIESVCNEMGAVLQRAAFSPNIKDRMDFSCAVFGPKGELCAQAAHIPVHLGSMTYAMKSIVSSVSWRSGDMLVLNDPFMGGTHLPDVTVIAPLYVDQQCLGFVANRAHHANIGSNVPGSMPLSTCLKEEGVIIPPCFLIKAGVLQDDVLEQLMGENVDSSVRTQVEGDFFAQVSANKRGESRLLSLVSQYSLTAYLDYLDALNDYGARLAQVSINQIPDGEYYFEDYLDCDGAGTENIKIAATVRVSYEGVSVDFTGTDKQVKGNVNCPLSVAAAAVYYVFRCLMPPHAPACAGIFQHIDLIAEPGSLLNARPPAAVAAGNVETSTRIVDVLLGALAQAIPERIPAASHGSMNNVAMGHRGDEGYLCWDYYETMGGGMGASVLGTGQNSVQTHMTNTLNTPIESLEQHYPLRVVRYGVRRGSGGRGHHVGGDGIVREIEFMSPSTVTLLTERRNRPPWGCGENTDGFTGKNSLNGINLPPKCCIDVVEGDRLLIETPGGGGWRG